MQNHSIRMNLEDVIKSMSESVMINSTATDSTSLFYGRAGMSICLFEVSRFLNNEFIEEFAFSLIKQSLLSKKRNIRFDSGLSGIGYSVNYLIRQNYIDANFFDIFYDQHEIIVTEFLNQGLENMGIGNLISLWNVIYYFNYVPDERVIDKIIQINRECNKRFNEIWIKISVADKMLNKEQIQVLWYNYLKAYSVFKWRDLKVHTDEYLNLINQGIIKTDISLKHCISKIELKEFEVNTSCINNINT